MGAMLAQRAGYFVCAALLLIPVHTAAQTVPTSPRPRRDTALEAIAATAVSLPPELAADALIRIASSPRVTDREWKRELLTEAFFRAYSAREPYRQATAQPVAPDTKDGARLFAYATSLNRVSLQVRAAQMMALVDGPAARELFQWIDLDLSPAVCDGLLAPAVDEYYSALSLVARTTFDDRTEALRFLELFLWRAHLPSEFPAVARALVRFQPRGNEAAYLESVFGFILETGTFDARGFSSSALDIVSRGADMAVAFQKLGVNPYFLMDTLRAYVITQVKAPRCADSPSESMTPAAFNTALTRTGMDQYIRPIDGATLIPSHVLGSARLEPYWQTGQAKALRQGAVDLRGTGPAPVPLRIRETEAWLNRAERLLVDVDQWTGNGEASDRDYFYQKASLYTALLDLIPRSKQRTKTIDSFVEFLRHKDEDRGGQPLWFAFVNRLLELSRDDNGTEILLAFENAHHPALWVYAQLEKLIPVGRR
jgi:hypothetical protein